MRLGISTASYFAKCALEETPAHIAACGAPLCEVFLNTFSEYRPAYVAQLRDRLRENGLSVYSVHPMGTQFEPQLFSLHPRQRADAWTVFEQVLRAARALGAAYYVMHGPASMHGTVKNMEFQRIGPILGELCDMAGEYGVRIAWENVSWCLFHYPEFCLRLSDACPSPALRFTLDIKQAARSGYGPLDYLAAIARCGRERLVNVHLCDYAVRDGRICPLLPGNGDFDFAALRDALLGSGYDGPAFLEVYSDLYRDEAQLCGCYRMLRQVWEGARRADASGREEKG